MKKIIHSDLLWFIVVQKLQKLFVQTGTNLTHVVFAEEKKACYVFKVFLTSGYNQINQNEVHKHPKAGQTVDQKLMVRQVFD